MKKIVLASIALFALSAPALAAGDAASGEKVFNKCKICHKVGEGAKTLIGPELNGVVGRKAASVEGFAYSEGLKKDAAEGLVWSEDKLTEYLKNPKAFNPTTKMAFAGLPKDEDIADVIAYLKTYAADGKKQ